METEIFQRLGLQQKLPSNVIINGRSGMDILDQLSHPGDEQYLPCPEAAPAPDVPRGSLNSIPGWTSTNIYEGTARDIVVYIPVQLRTCRGSPNVFVCNDGAYYLDPAGSVRAPLVLDSLIHSGSIPVTIGVFIQPGEVVSTDPDVLGAMDHEAWDQRSYEYDRLTDDYPRMLLEEFLPEVESVVGEPLATTPGNVAVCGVSSGAIAAFNAAWHMPERFGCVISHCGSFTNIHGGHNYPYLVRMTERKPIRVWMQSGEHDASAPWGDWPLANKVMAESLAYAGYDVEFVFGAGAHNLRHGGALFADALRWLWGPRQTG